MATGIVLIVDDDLLVARELGGLVTGIGYAAMAVTSTSDEAKGEASGKAPDLALVAMELDNGVRGFDLAHELRRRWRIPIILTTEDTDEMRLRRAGVVEPYGYVAKPFSPRELHLVLELALCKHESTTAVHALEDRFFAVSIDMLCFLDFNGYFKRLNPAWERVTGFTRAELMSRPFIEFVHPDDRERTLRQNREVREGGQALAFENRYLCKDGSYRWLRWNAAPDTDERVIYSAARDVTASKQAEEDREQLVESLQAALTEVSALREILPICSYCRKIRDDEDYWHTVEHYIARHTKTRFSHGICPSCMRTEVEPQLGLLERG